MRSYKEIVEIFETAANAHIAIKSFASGPISFLDTQNQNTKYPFVFLRPITSIGLSGNVRSLTFELYSLDVPSVSDEDAILVMSNTEQYLYDLGSYIRRGAEQQTMDFEMTNLNPVNEAFQDRLYGWVSNVIYTEPAVYNFCNFPKL
tara:strand:+ start:681 stop:1121 length:441 start_codon:yes stop_codon:yes gene_type:complete